MSDVSIVQRYLQILKAKAEKAKAEKATEPSTVVPQGTPKEDVDGIEATRRYYQLLKAKAEKAKAEKATEPSTVVPQGAAPKKDSRVSSRIVFSRKEKNKAIKPKAKPVKQQRSFVSKDDFSGKKLSSEEVVQLSMLNYIEDRFTAEKAEMLGDSLTDEAFLALGWSERELEIFQLIITNDQTGYLKARCEDLSIAGIDWKRHGAFGYAARAVSNKECHDAVERVFGPDAFGKKQQYVEIKKAETEKDRLKNKMAAHQLLSVDEFLSTEEEQVNIKIEQSTTNSLIKTAKRNLVRKQDPNNAVNKIMMGLNKSFKAPPNGGHPTIYAAVCLAANRLFIKRGKLAAEKGCFQFFGSQLKIESIERDLPDEYILSMFINAVVSCYLRDYLITNYTAMFKGLKGTILNELKAVPKQDSKKARLLNDALGRIDSIYHACCLPPEGEILNLRLGRYPEGKPILRLPEVFIDLDNCEEKDEGLADQLKAAVQNYRDHMDLDSFKMLFEAVKEFFERTHDDYIKFPIVNGRPKTSIEVLTKYRPHWKEADGTERQGSVRYFISELAKVLNCKTWHAKHLIITAFKSSTLDETAEYEYEDKIRDLILEKIPDLSSSEADLGKLPQETPFVSGYRISQMIEQQYLPFMEERNKFDIEERSIEKTFAQIDGACYNVDTAEIEVSITFRKEETDEIITEETRALVYVRCGCGDVYGDDGRIHSIGGIFDKWFVRLSPHQQKSAFDDEALRSMGLIRFEEGYDEPYEYLPLEKYMSPYEHDDPDFFKKCGNAKDLIRGITVYDDSVGAKFELGEN